MLRKSFRIPQRLLLIGLPLTIVLGFGVGSFLFSGLTLLEIALVSTILAPTDAALGKAVVTDKSVPPDIREGLNVESGLNDGICVPILFIFLALATDTGSHDGTALLAVKSIAEEIGFGVAVGAGITWLGTRLITYCMYRRWITETWRQLPVVALAAVCYTVAQSIGGSGFIATFVGGLFFGGITKHRKHELLLAAEGSGDVLALITWVIFGAAVTGHYVRHITWEAILYAALSLTVIRMLPVYLCLSGLGLRFDQKLFIGWFGPRGMASIVFAVIVTNHNLPGENLIIITVATTILLSILAHGASASPLVELLARRLKRDRAGG